MIIRQIQQSDKKRWISFFQGLSGDTIENRYYYLIKNKDVEVARRTWINLMHDSISLIAEVNNKIVGCSELYINQSTNHGEIAITIADKYQGNGIGSKLVEEIERIAKEKGLKMIWFITQNIRMKKIAQKYNYVKNKYNWEKEI